MKLTKKIKHEAKKIRGIGDYVTIVIDKVPTKVQIERFGPAPNISVKLHDGKIIQVPIVEIKL